MSCCPHAWPMRRKTTKQIMDPDGFSRASRDSVSVTKYPTEYRRYSIDNSGSSQQAQKVKVRCKSCKTEFPVPTGTNDFRCRNCQANNAPNQGQGQSSGGKICNGVRKFGAICKGRVDAGRRNVNVMDQKPYLSSEPSLSFPRRNNKRAVLCGVTYKKRKFRLKGTINDVKNMKIMLTDIFGFSDESIRVLTGILQNLLADDSDFSCEFTVCSFRFHFMVKSLQFV